LSVLIEGEVLMKKNIILSFHPDFFRPILYGIKKYEYRKSFCKEPVRAYLYLTRPVSEFIGIMELGKVHHPGDIKSMFSNNHDINKRMDVCIENKERAIVPIESFRMFKKPISLSEIKKIGIDFTVPRAFTYIDNKEILKYLESLETFEKEFFHSHEYIYKDNIGVMCSEMEKLDEFIQMDKEFMKSERAILIKSQYVNKP
jgi:predicted transcriptional regulator